MHGVSSDKRLGGQSMVHGGSVSLAAIEFCREQNITTIAGGCPLMYGKTADFGHKCMRWVMGLTGGLRN